MTYVAFSRLTDLNNAIIEPMTLQRLKKCKRLDVQERIEEEQQIVLNEEAYEAREEEEKVDMDVDDDSF